MKMEAKILPLEGKYYGTNVEITTGRADYILELWSGLNGSGEPSDRELDGICTIEQWRRNEVLPIQNSWTGEIGVPAQEAFEVCDSHFENRHDYAVAQELVRRINGPMSAEREHAPFVSGAVAEPCPLCGEDPLVIPVVPQLHDSGGSVRCTNSLCKMQRRRPIVGETREEAIDNWNTVSKRS